MTRRLAVLGALLALMLAGCSSDPGSTSSAPEGSGPGSEADEGSVRWGDGPYGVVLAHGAAFDAASWSEQATAIAAQGATVVAVEDISPDAIAAAVTDLQGEGLDRVALVGGSAGSDAILDLSAQQPDLADQLVLLSSNSTGDDPGGLGSQPKLFIASADEPVSRVSTELADQAPGDDNQALIVPGSDHAQGLFAGDQGQTVLEAMLERLDQR